MQERGRKRTLIADSLHNAIAVTELEKAVLSTQVFSRLHNVLQNSTAYLTYPSVRTSRFAHSLGCMHLAGEIFKHGLSNASTADRRAFLVELEGGAGSVEDQAVYGELASKLFSSMKPGVVAALPTDTEAVILPILALAGDYSKSVALAVAACYQGLRLAALLHDVAHPPFSHVTEFALEHVLERIRTQKKTRPLNAREEKFVAILGVRAGESSGKLHEGLGPPVSALVLRSALMARKEVLDVDSGLDLGRYLFEVRSAAIALLVLQSVRGEGTWGVLHAIFEEDLDADRLDFVPRDSSVSALEGSYFPYERILSFFTLTGNAQDGRSKFSFLPAVQSLSAVEEFYGRRFSLYKYVVHHHRVVKTDTLLKESLISLTEDALANPLDPPPLTNHSIPADINWLWSVLDKKINWADDDAVNHLLQWDDSWLITALRAHYYQLKEEARRTPAHELLSVRLEELLSNRKRYSSLFKREDDFLEVDNACLGELAQEGNWEKLASATARDSAVSHAIDDAKAYLHLEPFVAARADVARLIEGARRASSGASDRNPSAEIAAVRDTQGLLCGALWRLSKIRDNLFASTKEWTALRRVSDAIQKNFGLDDVLCVTKVLGPGVRRGFRLSSARGPVELDSVSGIRMELERRSRRAVPFFVYVYRKGAAPLAPGQMFASDELTTMRAEFGERLAREVIADFSTT